jgi:hypothetical protein
MVGIEQQELAMETLGMILAESNALLAGGQGFMIAQAALKEAAVCAASQSYGRMPR